MVVHSVLLYFCPTQTDPGTMVMKCKWHMVLQPWYCLWQGEYCPLCPFVVLSMAAWLELFTLVIQPFFQPSQPLCIYLFIYFDFFFFFFFWGLNSPEKIPVSWSILSSVGRYFVGWASSALLICFARCHCCSLLIAGEQNPW